MKTRRVRGGAAADLPMTPMIDIVLLHCAEAGLGNLSVVTRRAD